MPIIQTINLSKIYGQGETAITAIDRINLKVESGEFVAVMGPSGCGKSTLLHLLGGLDHPSSGDVFIAGQNLSTMEDDRLSELRRRRLGVCFSRFTISSPC